MRRLGSLERQLDQVTARLADLESAIERLTGTLDAQLPRLHREVVTTAAMVDAVAAQVAADTDAMARRLDRLEPLPAQRRWRRWLGPRDDDSSRDDA